MMYRFFLFAFLFFGFSLCGMDARLKKLAVKKRRLSKRKRKGNAIVPQALVEKRNKKRKKKKIRGSDGQLNKRRRIRPLGQIKKQRRNRTITTLPGKNSRRIPVRQASKKIKKIDIHRRGEIEEDSSEKKKDLKQKIESTTLNEKRQEFIEDESGQQKARTEALAKAGRDSFSGNGLWSRRRIRSLSTRELLEVSCQSDS